MPIATLNGAQIYYEIDGEGPETILFAHGLLWDTRLYDPQVAELSKHYRCVRFDFRGQGRSQVTSGGYDMDSLAEDAAALISHLELAPCHFVGLSMGGFIAMRLAIHHPELLKTMTLLETSADREPAENIPRYRLLNLVARWLGLRLVTRLVMTIMFGETFLNDPTRAHERKEYIRRLRANDRIGITRATTGIIERKAVYDQLGQIKTPTLIMVGEQDQATVPEKSKRMQAAIAGSKLVFIPDAGHTSTLEQPEFINQQLIQFLKQ